MTYKVIHIWDLPIEQIYIKLRPEFRDLVFKKLREKFGSDSKIARFIVKKNYHISKWRRGVNDYPLGSLLKLTKFLNINKNTLERNIILIKTAKNGNTGKGTGIKNPKLPFALTPDMSQLVGHFLHDGSIKENEVYYTSKSKEILNQITALVKSEVGEIKEPSFFVSSYGGITIIFPRLVSLLLVYGFNCKIGSKIKSDPQVPKIILKSNNLQIIKQYLRAAFSDDGCVAYHKYSRFIVIGLAKKHDGVYNPPQLLQGCHLMVSRLGMIPTRITLFRYYKTQRGEKREAWWFRISNKKGLIFFRDHIGFLQEYKNKKLNDAIFSYSR